MKGLIMVSGRSPAFEQVGHFATGSEFVANAIWADLLKLFSPFGCHHQITRMNHSPQMENGLWFLLPIHKPSGNSCMLSQVFRPTQSLFRLLIFQIGINDLKLTWNPSRLRFTQIQKDDGLVTSITDSQANNSLIAVTPRYENGQD